MISIIFILCLILFAYVMCPRSKPRPKGRLVSAEYVEEYIRNHSLAEWKRHYGRESKS